MSIRFIWTIVLLKPSVSLLSFCLIVLFLQPVLRSSVIIVLFSSSPFHPFNVCLIYLLQFRVHVYLQLLYPLGKLTSLSSYNVFVCCDSFNLKSALSCISMANPALLIIMSFSVLSLSGVTLNLKCMPCGQHMVGSYLLVHSVMLFLLIVEFNLYLI